MGTIFHSWIRPLFTGIGLFVLNLLVSLGMALDHILFPALRKVRIQKPIVIVGNPRSGTSFLQRFLVSNQAGAGMRIWKMIFPSLLLQTMLKPFLPFLERFNPARDHPGAIHETSLTGVETDDPSLLFRYIDGFFLYGFFLAFARKDHRSMFDPDLRDTAHRDFTWLKNIWKRNLISEKRERVVAKLFSLGTRLPRFLSKFPDAKILYLVRDPLETVPSTLSLVTGVLEARFGFWSLAEAKRRLFSNRLYDALLELSRRFLNDYNRGLIPAKNVMIVTYQRMMKDFENLMKEILSFIEVEITPDFLKTIRETAEKQRHYQSRHTYNLSQFGLDKEKIRKDYAQVYEAFLK
jgi:hypothetical protein